MIAEQGAVCVCESEILCECMGKQGSACACLSVTTPLSAENHLKCTRLCVSI